MKNAIFFVLTIALLFPLSQPHAQSKTTGDSAQKLPTSKPTNAQIQKIVREISASNIEAIIKKLVSFGTRHSLSETESNERGIGAARRWIKSEFDRYSRESGGRLQVAFDEFTQQPTQRIPTATQLVNVVATLPGKQPESKDRIYVVSGHYDSCVCAQGVLDAKTDAPGANDDGSGTAAVMEIARVMSKYEYDATLVFMTVAAEEQGLNGSTHWAEIAKEKKLDVAGMITNDIIGSSRAEDGHIDKTHVRLFAGELPARGEMTPGMRALLEVGGENDSPTRQLARHIKEIGEQYVAPMNVTVIYRRDRYGRGGDHSPFLDRGFPAVRMTEPNEDLKHQHQTIRKENGVQYGDLPEFVDFEFIAQVARVNAAALASLALGPAGPSNVQLETTGSTNDAILRWDANKEPDVAGYQIVWRETTAPFWQNKVAAGEVTKFTVKGVSRDNYLFGLQAVDKDGNVSVAVFPKPFRPARRTER